MMELKSGIWQHGKRKFYPGHALQELTILILLGLFLIMKSFSLLGPQRWERRRERVMYFSFMNSQYVLICKQINYPQIWKRPFLVLLQLFWIWNPKIAHIFDNSPWPRDSHLRAHLGIFAVKSLFPAFWPTFKQTLCNNFAIPRTARGWNLLSIIGNKYYIFCNFL